MVDQVIAEIKGAARVIAGDDDTFSGVRYRISVVELQGRRSLLQGTIEAEPSVMPLISASSGWFGFYVTDEHRGTIRLMGPADGADQDRPRASRTRRGAKEGLPL